MMYCTLVEKYLVLNRDMRSNNVQLFASALFHISSLFFSTNYPNYARWMSRYALDLLNIDETYPGLSEVLEGGAFSVCRGNQDFLELESTWLWNKLSMQVQKPSQRNCGLCQYRFSSQKMVKDKFDQRSASKQVAGNSCLHLYSGEMHKDPQSSRMRQDDKDLAALTRSIYSALNHFYEYLAHDVLFNLKTGKEASAETMQCLLTLTTRGRAARDTCRRMQRS